MVAITMVSIFSDHQVPKKIRVLVSRLWEILTVLIRTPPLVASGSSGPFLLMEAGSSSLSTPTQPTKSAFFTVGKLLFPGSGSIELS